MSAAPYFVIVDNNDANVTIVGSNITAPIDSYLEYAATGIAVNGTNTTVGFEFWGTSVDAYHTLGPGVPNGLTCSLDGNSTSVSQALAGTLVPHFNIFSSITLPYGLHTLQTSIGKSGDIPGQNNALMVVDYYIVSRPKEAGVAGLTLLYDDMHSDFEYDGEWATQSGRSAAFLHMNWTLHGAVSQGASASLNFTGSSIKVYGSIRENSTGPIADFSVDSEPATTASVAFPAPSATLNVSANQLLYQRESIGPGSHTLQMTALASNIFYFDYITVTGSEQINNSQTGFQTMSSSSGGSPSSSTDVTGARHHNSHAGQPAVPKTPVGTIVGAVIGVVVAVALIVAATSMLLWRRRKNHRDRPRMLYTANERAPAVGQPHQRLAAPGMSRAPARTSPSLHTIVIRKFSQSQRPPPPASFPTSVSATSGEGARI